MITIRDKVRFVETDMMGVVHQLSALVRDGACGLFAGLWHHLG